MFMNTIAVGPLDEVASWVTGGTTVAIERWWEVPLCKEAWVVHIAVVLAIEVGKVCLESCNNGFRKAIL